MSAAEHLKEEAALAWLAGEGDAVPCEDGEGSVSGTAPTVPQPSAAPSHTESAPEDSGIRVKAKSGHSPSARALVNAGDAVARLADMTSTAPPVTLRSRVLGSGALAAALAQRAGKAPAPVAIEFPGIGKLTSPNELLGRLHQADPREAARTARIEQLHAAGGPGEAATDRAIAQVLEQIAPFFGFEVVLISAVLGDKTIHRVHRGFPPQLGSMDIVPRELSFCTHTISAAEPFFVEDTLAEAFFRSSALVHQFGARAYLGVPLFSEEIALGALCAIAASPQRITEHDVAFLSRFAEITQAFVLHDTAAIAARTTAGAPATLSAAQLAEAGTSASGRIVYAPSFFDGLVRAQAARAKGDPAAHASSTVTLAASSIDLATAVPANVVVSVDGTELALLVPARHPESQRLIEQLVSRGGTVRPL